MFYSVLRCLSHALLLNWYNNKLGEKQQNHLEMCCLIQTKSRIKLRSWRGNTCWHYNFLLVPAQIFAWIVATSFTCWPEICLRSVSTFTSKLKTFLFSQAYDYLLCAWLSVVSACGVDVGFFRSLGGWMFAHVFQHKAHWYCNEICYWNKKGHGIWHWHYTV